MTRLDKAMATLSKAMGPRPYVVVYESTHDDAEQAKVSLAYHVGWVRAVGLLAYASHRIQQPQKQEQEEGA